MDPALRLAKLLALLGHYGATSAGSGWLSPRRRSAASTVLYTVTSAIGQNALLDAKGAPGSNSADLISEQCGSANYV